MRGLVFVKNVESKKRGRKSILSLFLCLFSCYAARKNDSVSQSFRSLDSSSKRSISRRKYALHSSSVIVHPPFPMVQFSPLASTLSMPCTVLRSASSVTPA